MNDFVKTQGVGYLANVLLRLYDHLLRGFDEWYPEAGMITPARMRSALLALSEHKQLSVTELAAMVGVSHPLLISWINYARELGLVRTRPDAEDRRRSLVSLTARGREEVRKNAYYSRNVARRAYERLLEEADAKDLFEALWRVEEACRRKPFADRLREAHAEVGDLPAPDDAEKPRRRAAGARQRKSA